MTNPQMMIASELAKNKATPWIVGGLVIGIPLLAYFGIYRPIMKKLGIIEGADGKALTKVVDQMKGAGFWSPSWYKQNGGDTITDEEASIFAEKINDSFGVFNDDEEQIYGVFATLGSKGNISKVAEAYSIKYNFRDLYTDLEDYLNTDELANIAQKISLYGSK